MPIVTGNLRAMRWLNRRSKPIKTLLGLAALMILCAPVVYGEAQQFDFKSQVGVVDVKEDGKL
jgi:hypothetical protein